MYCHTYNPDRDIWNKIDDTKPILQTVAAPLTGYFYMYRKVDPASHLYQSNRAGYRHQQQQQQQQQLRQKRLLEQERLMEQRRQERAEKNEVPAGGNGVSKQSATNAKQKSERAEKKALKEAEKEARITEQMMHNIRKLMEMRLEGQHQLNHNESHSTVLHGDNPIIVESIAHQKRLDEKFVLPEVSFFFTKKYCKAAKNILYL